MIKMIHKGDGPLMPLRVLYVALGILLPASPLACRERTLDTLFLAG